MGLANDGGSSVRTQRRLLEIGNRTKNNLALLAGRENFGGVLVHNSVVGWRIGIDCSSVAVSFG